LQGLRDLGYVEGQNILIEYRYAKGDDALLPELAAELVRLNVEVILTWGVTAARVVTKATTTIPIVNGSMSDPVAASLVQSLARPGGNLTGLTSQTPALSTKRVELLKEVVPGLSRVTALSTAGRTAKLALHETEAAARSLEIQLHAVEVRGPGDLDDAFGAAAKAGAGGVIVMPDLLFTQHLQRLVELVAKHRLPTTYFSRDFVDAGGLLSYAPSFPDMFRRAATYVHRILKGMKPRDLPIEQAARFELVINLKTAKALRLTIPPSVLLRADQLIQ
jgi:putative ABC transport system substrate-binding protein